MYYYSSMDILSELLRRVAASSQVKVCEELHLTPSLVNDVVHGRRPISERMAESLGFLKAPDRYYRKGTK